MSTSYQPGTTEHASPHRETVRFVVPGPERLGDQIILVLSALHRAARRTVVPH